MKPGFAPLAPGIGACEAPGGPVSPGWLSHLPRGGGVKVRTPGLRGLPCLRVFIAGGGGTAPSDSRAVRSWSPPPSSCIARLRVVGSGDHHCGKTYFVFYERLKSSLSRQSSNPLFLSWGILYLIFINSNRNKEDPLFLQLFFSGFFFFLFFLPLTALSCKEETPTYVLPHLCGSEDFISPAQFHDLGWIFMYKSSRYGFYLKTQQNAGR